MRERPSERSARERKRVRDFTKNLINYDRKESLFWRLLGSLGSVIKKRGLELEGARVFLLREFKRCFIIWSHYQRRSSSNETEIGSGTNLALKFFTLAKDRLIILVGNKDLVREKVFRNTFGRLIRNLDWRLNKWRINLSQWGFV